MHATRAEEPPAGESAVNPGMQIYICMGRKGHQMRQQAGEAAERQIGLAYFEKPIIGALKEPQWCSIHRVRVNEVIRVIKVYLGSVNGCGFLPCDLFQGRKRPHFGRRE